MGRPPTQKRLPYKPYKGLFHYGWTVGQGFSSSFARQSWNVWDVKANPENDVGPLAHNLVRVRRSRSRTLLRGASTGREAIRRYSQRRRSNPSRFFGDDFAIFPYVDRRAVHARGLARHFGGAAQRAAHRGGEFFRFLFRLGSSSWSSFQQLWRAAGIIIHAPGIS